MKTTPDFAELIDSLTESEREVLLNVVVDASDRQFGENSLRRAIEKAALAGADLAFVKKRFRDFFQRIADLAAAAPPPGAHATNGYFRDYMAQDRILASYRSPVPIPLGSDAQALFEVFKAVHEIYIRIFTVCQNPQGNRTWDFLRHALGDIIRFVGNIINAIQGNDQQRQQALAKISAEVQPMLEHLNEQGNMPRIGAHASGWIAFYMNQHAGGALGLMNNALPLARRTGDVGAIAKVLETTFVAIGQLETKGHDPWLKGAWQLQFLAIMRAAVAGLESIPAVGFFEQPNNADGLGPFLTPEGDSPASLG